jgi:hypothetical protein
LYLLDLQNPANPVELTNINTDERNILIKRLGNYVYIVWSDTRLEGFVIASGIRIFNIVNPAAPVEVNFDVSTSESGINDVFIRNDRLITAWGETIRYGGPRGGMFIYDTADPAAPQLLGEYRDPENSYGIQVAAMGDFAYLGTKSDSGSEIQSGIFTFDISDPSDPTVIGYAKPLIATEMIDYGEYIYTLDHNQDLLVARFAVTETIQPDIFSMIEYSYAQAVNISVEVSPGTVTETTKLYLAPIPGLWPKLGNAVIGHGFDLVAYQDGLRKPALALSQPVTISLTYSDAAIPGILDDTQIRLDWWDLEAWQDAAATCAPPSIYQVDLEGNEVQIVICQLGRFAFTGPTRVIFFPLINHSPSASKD